MKRISRILLGGAFTIILIAAACAPVAGQGALNLPGPFLQDDATDTPAAVATDTTLTPSTPGTGPNVISLDCQYCVDSVAHAQLLLPRKATFKVISPPELAKNDDDENGDDDGDDDDGDDHDNGDRMGCRTIDKFRDTKLVLCRAEENTTITLNVCQDDACREVQLTLQSCALTTGTPSPVATTTVTATFTPLPVTATSTLTFTPVAPATETPTPPVATDTPTASTTSTSTATSTPTSTPTP
jgi:hypothetical protein